MSEQTNQNNKTRTRTLVECAVLISLGTVLSMIKIPIGHLGGSVTLFSALPLVVICYRHGVKWGFASAFIYSTLQILVDISTVAKLFAPGEGLKWYLAILSILLDYLVAFTVIGTASLFRNMKHPTAALTVGSLVGLSCRFVAHFFSGWILYGAWASWYFDAAEEGSFASKSDSTARFGTWVLEHMGSGQGLAAFYSAFYNGLYMVPEIVLTVIGAAAISAIPFVIEKSDAVNA